MSSSSPAPKTGVGMRKMRLPAAAAAAKLGCTKVQPFASVSPETVKMVSTPPLGALVLAVPSLLKKNGKRASRVGPWAVMNVGVVSFGPAMPLAIAVNSGLLAPPVPPTVGCEWQPAQLLKLKRGPRPLLAVPEMASEFWKRVRPLLKKSCTPVGVFAATELSGSGLVAVAPACPLIAPGRTPGSVCAKATPLPETTKIAAHSAAGCNLFAMTLFSLPRLRGG